MAADAVTTILVYRVGLFLGDSLVSLPAINAIRERHPDARLVLLTSRADRISAREVLGATGLFSEFLYYDAVSRTPRAFVGLMSLARNIRRHAPSRLYYLAPSPRSARQVSRDRFFFRRLCGIRNLVGMSATDAWVGKWDANGPVRIQSEAARLLAVAAGAAHVSAKVELPIGLKERESVNRLWNASGIPESAVTIALGVGAKSSAARWPVDRFRELASRLLTEFPLLHIVLIGGRSDSRIAIEVCRALGLRVHDWTGKLEVWESAEAMRRCALYVGNDSGPMHLAAAVGLRCVAIFSARAHPGMWEPLGENHIVIRKNVPCAGCMLSDCLQYASRCLTEISVDEVFDACSDALSAALPA